MLWCEITSQRNQRMKSVFSAFPLLDNWLAYEPLARYIKLRVAHAPGMSGTFSPPQGVSDPDVHPGTRVTHVPWCMPGSQTMIFYSVAGKRFPAFPAHAQCAFLRSKRSMKRFITCTHYWRIESHLFLWIWDGNWKPSPKPRNCHHLTRLWLLRKPKWVECIMTWSLIRGPLIPALHILHILL